MITPRPRLGMVKSKHGPAAQMLTQAWQASENDQLRDEVLLLRKELELTRSGKEGVLAGSTLPERHLKLAGSTLLYWRSQGDSHPAGSLDLQGCLPCAGEEQGRLIALRFSVSNAGLLRLVGAPEQPQEKSIATH